MGDTPVPDSQAGVVSGALLEAAAEAVLETAGEDVAAPITYYKGVYKTPTNHFAASFGRARGLHLGKFDTAEDAARAFDAHARSLGHKVLNFPNAAAGEVQAVKGETSQATLKRAAGGASSSARAKRAAPAAGAAS